MALLWTAILLFLILVVLLAALAVWARLRGEERGDFTFHAAAPGPSAAGARANLPVVNITVRDKARKKDERRTGSDDDLADLRDPSTDAFDAFDPTSQSFYDF